MCPAKLISLSLSLYNISVCDIDMIIISIVIFTLHDVFAIHAIVFEAISLNTNIFYYFRD